MIIIIESLPPEAEACCYVKGVLSALLYLQERHISHGMISSKNIYFDEEFLLYRVYD
jgi:serine/threonine protein kinase